MPNSDNNDDTFVMSVGFVGDVAFLPQLFAGLADHAFGFSDG
jgi:hypothetical protein